jgi:hypothetical protein
MLFLYLRYHGTGDSSVLEGILFYESGVLGTEIPHFLYRMGKLELVCFTAQPENRQKKKTIIPAAARFGGDGTASCLSRHLNEVDTCFSRHLLFGVTWVTSERGLCFFEN